MVNRIGSWEIGTYVGNHGERRGEGTNPLTPAGLEEEEKHRHKEDVSSAARVRGEADWVVPEQPIDQGGNDCHRNLTNDICRAEGEPSVDTARIFTSFPKGAVDIELGDDTVQDNGRDKNDQEDGEHAILHATDGVVEHPEGLP